MRKALDGNGGQSCGRSGIGSVDGSERDGVQLVAGLTVRLMGRDDTPHPPPHEVAT